MFIPPTVKVWRRCGYVTVLLQGGEESVSQPTLAGEDTSNAEGVKRCHTPGCGQSTSTRSFPGPETCPRALASSADSGFGNTQARCVVAGLLEPSPLVRALGGTLWLPLSSSVLF